MNHIFLERRDGRLALYLSGDLQFDARDERLYHEPLALVPAALAARRAPRRRLRALILGGGDGLALREVLRSPQVAEAHVVDRDPEVLRLGAGELVDLNGGAFRDPRAHAHALDARDFLGGAGGFDILICDLTYPRDVAGTALYSLAFFQAVRAALRPGGILAVNAVSPELTPQAFGCIGTTLAAAGLWAVPYAFDLPSFREEGYGRWGFFFASPRAVARRELRALRLPGAVALTPEAVLAGSSLPAAAAGAMRAAPNRTDELLYYLCNATPLAWQGPLRPLRFAPSAAAEAGRGPRLTAAQGFARWLRAPEGRRSLEELLACLPLSRRGQTREAIREWSQHAEALFREVDLRAFVEAALRRADELPRVWGRELRALRDRLRNGLPSAGELLHQAYRVFAVFLLVLLLANLFFPDTLYAKHGFAGGSGRSPSSSATSSMSFSDPGARYSPYRYRWPSGGTSYYHSGSGTPPPRDRVADPEGRQYPAQRFLFTDPQGGRKPVSALLALSRELQLLDSGALAYVPGVPAHQFLLEPGRLRVLNAAGQEVAALLPTAQLQEQARQQIGAQAPLLQKAIADHRRWVDWVGWARTTVGAQEAGAELQHLEAIQRAVETARGTWGSSGGRPAVEPGPGWFPIFPGVYLEAPKPRAAERRAGLVSGDGSLRARSLAPPAQLGNEDRFLFWVLNRRFTQERDASLKEIIERWTRIHGEALGAKPAPAAAPGGRR